MTRSLRCIAGIVGDVATGLAFIPVLLVLAWSEDRDLRRGREPKTALSESLW